MAKIKTKKWLKRITLIDVQLKSKAEELKRMTELEKLCEVSMPTNRIHIKNIIDKLNQDIELLLRQRVEITDTISKVGDQVMRVLLEQRYIHDTSISIIAGKIKYSTRQTKRLMEAAIEEVAEIVDGDQN